MSACRVTIPSSTASPQLAVTHPSSPYPLCCNEPHTLRLDLFPQFPQNQKLTHVQVQRRDLRRSSQKGQAGRNKSVVCIGSLELRFWRGFREEASAIRLRTSMKSIKSRRARRATCHLLPPVAGSSWHVDAVGGVRNFGILFGRGYTMSCRGTAAIAAIRNTQPPLARPTPSYSGNLQSVLDRALTPQSFGNVFISRIRTSQGRTDLFLCRVGLHGGAAASVAVMLAGDGENVASGAKPP